MSLEGADTEAASTACQGALVASHKAETGYLLGFIQTLPAGLHGLQGCRWSHGKGRGHTSGWEGPGTASSERIPQAEEAQGPRRPVSGSLPKGALVVWKSTE